MKVVIHFLAVFAALFTTFASPHAHAQEPAPLSAYGALPEVEDAAISSSGNNIAILLTAHGTRQVVFFDSDMKLIRRVAAGETKVRYFDWIGDDQLLLVTSQTEDLWGFTTDKAEFSVARLIPVTYEGEIETVFAKRRDLVNSVLGNYGVRKVDGEWAAYFGAIELQRTGRTGGYNWDNGRPFLYQFGTRSGQARRISNSARQDESRDWVVDASGNVAATLDVSLKDGDWVLKANDTIIAQGNERNGRVGLVGLGYDGRSVIYSARDEENISRWYEIPLAGGEARPFLREVDIERLYWDESTGHLIGYLDVEKGPVFNDPAHQKAATGIRKAFADFDLRMVDWSPDFKKVLVRTSGNGDSGSWFVVDLTNGKAQAIAYEREALTPQRVGEVSTFEFTAADGLEMDGILTLPPGTEASNLPLVMLPHGGPHSHDREQFDWWAQAFASRGYAVFQPNFRGSTNRSQSFKLAGYGEWGRKMQTDLSDGLAALADKGIVDPDRACIVGASYGGYAALAGVTLQQDLYRCAVAVAPVSDISAMFNEDYRASGGQPITKAALLDQLGPKDRWHDVSPRRFADRADAPIMLIHGKDDTVVPYSHSHKMADALKDAGKPYEIIALEGEDHWLSLSTTRLQMLEAAVGFVQKHNPAD
ncbi:alpha/beta hydrolase family protein [Qipengyuania sp. NPDC077563]|uniref:alpha/beta hydrolase family protein n=1 Tax=Qipengyuania sp. NPDC077563 TaxID=3364497 RepID=UPI00384E2B5A